MTQERTDNYTMPTPVVAPKPVPPEFSTQGLAAYTNGKNEEVESIDVEAAALRATKVLKDDKVACYRQ